MSELIASHNLGYLAVLFMVVMMVRGRSDGSFAMLLASLLLIGLAVGHVLWNVIVALLLGGIGINLFCSWLTAVPGSKLRQAGLPGAPH